MHHPDINDLIKGKENLPADSVFTNVKILQRMTAERFIGTMKIFTKALGVRCTFCHNTEKWASDEKPNKEIARGMMKMTETINKDLLTSIEGLKGEHAFVGCETCHRGKEKP
ncbi:MAG: c-type cytochrome [Bacteroidetes bacterium]|nr:c-type cytochrome [Bacteroidota bacterium]